MVVQVFVPKHKCFFLNVTAKHTKGTCNIEINQQSMQKKPTSNSQQKIGKRVMDNIYKVSTVISIALAIAILDATLSPLHYS